MRQQHNLSAFIKSEALKLGFSSCGIAKSEFLEETAPRLEKWLKNGFHGSMKYMENHFDKRLDPSKLVPGSKSVISLMYNYYPSRNQIEDSYKISKYAYGEDYHGVIKNKLSELVRRIQSNFGDFHARVFTDSAPVMERNWAQRSGLGWLGKNALLISKDKGSFFFLAEIITDLKIEPDQPFHTDHCGNCTRCIEACPTDAILKNNTVDASKCISYYTIELKEEIPETARGFMEDWMFGCDICQDVCPWNRFSLPHQEDRFEPSLELMSMKKKDWEELTNQAFKRLFKNSAVNRTKFSGLSRNIGFLKT